MERISRIPIQVFFRAIRVMRGERVLLLAALREACPFRGALFSREGARTQRADAIQNIS
jgi:hypothetical protein